MEEKEPATPGPWETSKHNKMKSIGSPKNWRYVQHHFPEHPYEGEFSDEWGVYPPLGEAGPVALVSGEENAKLIARAPELREENERLKLQIEVTRPLIEAVLAWRKADSSGRTDTAAPLMTMLHAINDYRFATEKRCSASAPVGKFGGTMVCNEPLPCKYGHQEESEKRRHVHDFNLSDGSCSRCGANPSS